MIAGQRTRITGSVSHDMTVPEVVLTGPDGPRLLRIFIHANVPDDQDEFLPIDLASIGFDNHIARGGPVIDSHTNKVRGRLLSHWEQLHPKLKVPAIRGELQIFDMYKGDDRFWNDIKAGRYRGSSWGGDAVKIRDHCMDDACIMRVGRYAEPPEIYELSLVDKPSNPGADGIDIDRVKAAAHVCSEHQQRELQRIKTAVRRKPLAGFDDFDDCVNTLRQDPDVDDPEALCASLERKKGEAGQLSTVMQGVIHEAYTLWADDLTKAGLLSTNDRKIIGGAVGDLLGRIEQVLPKRLATFELIRAPDPISDRVKSVVYAIEERAKDLADIEGIEVRHLQQGPPLVVHAPRDRMHDLEHIKGVKVEPLPVTESPAERADRELTQALKRERLKALQRLNAAEEDDAAAG